MFPKKQETKKILVFRAAFFNINLPLGTPKPSKFRGYDPYIEGPKTFIFHGFWGPKVGLMHLRG